jgi:hypothetical protein
VIGCVCVYGLRVSSPRSKNYKVHADGSADENSSLTGQAVVRLQALLPRARVVYASATGVTDISNMAYFSRLGLWNSPANTNVNVNDMSAVIPAADGGSGFADFKSFEQVTPHDTR